MTMKLFAVRDVKADAFGAPMSIATSGLALRSFSDACQDERSEFAKYPEDYMLYEIGEYDPNSGAIKSHPVPKLVATAVSVRSKPIVEKYPKVVSDPLGIFDGSEQEVAK